MNDCPDKEDVFDEETGISKSMTDNELDGHPYDMMNKGSNNKNKSDRGCRIIIGWNEDDVNINLIHSTKQTMLCLVEIKDSKCYFFCCLVYAANSGKERKILWKDLGIHFTWVQSRQNPSNGILKKIDRVFGNVEFMSKFPNLHALFLPHLTSDYSPTVLIFPKMMNKKHKAFRFSNFIADNPNFLCIVQEN
ncbi:hypothetical protein Tco_1558440 [Tanacetum coccineum]